MVLCNIKLRAWFIVLNSDCKMVATYTLHLTYSDPCYQDRLRLIVFSAAEICAEICKVGTYEEHWAKRHPVTIDGSFPFVASSFPTRAFVVGILRGLAVGQRRYVYQSRIDNASYTAIVQRLS